MIFWSKKNKSFAKKDSHRRHYTQSDMGVCFEPLEPRLLLSGSWGAGSDAPSQETKSNNPGGFGQETAALHDDAGISGMIVRQQQGLQVAGRVDLLAKATALNAAEADQDANAPASSIQNNTAGDPSRLTDQQSSTAVEVSNEIIFVDTSVHNYSDLVDDLLANSDGDREFEVILLETGRDGIDQISEALALRQQVDAVHFVTHGNDRAIKLGATWLSSDNMEAYANDVSTWQNALTQEADLLFYGCELAAGSDGRMLLETMKTLTGADVAASDDLTGNSLIGGDWHLEYGRGTIETNIAFSQEIQAQWDSVLAAFTVDTTADTADANPGDGIAEDASGNTSLRAAIEEANALGGADEITLNPGTYTLTGGELAITADLTITGSDPRTTLIDGDAADRVFSINNSTVTLTGITVMNGDANNSGGVFVENGSTLYLSDSIVRDNNSNMGGGVHVHGTAHLERVLLYNNTANEGGGIHFHGADGGSLTNVTISGNTASNEGGGLWSDSSITIRNTTIADNTATNQGGGLYRSAGTFDIGNSIVADNSAGFGRDVWGIISSSGSNIFESMIGGLGFDLGSDVSPVDPLLGLSDNGGTMMTHVPTAAEAIDGADRGLMSITDQRGFLRGDGAPDIGAYEVGASAASTGDYLDRFDTDGSFAGDDGVFSWSNDWQEIGESNGAASGDVRVFDNYSGDGGGNIELRISTDLAAWREANLSGATSATLSFDYARVDIETGDDLVVYIQSGGDTGGVTIPGAPGTWDEIDRLTGPANDAAYLSNSIDISAYIASDTRIMFKADGATEGNDYLYVDNIRINLAGAAPSNSAPTATNLSSTSAYNEGDATVAITDIEVSDADAGETITATLTLVDTSTGSLSANNGATYTAGTGVWTITNTVANVNLALANLVFTPNTDNDVDTTIDVVIDDGDEDAGGPLTGTITLDVTPTNDAPTATNLSSTSAYNEGDATVAITNIIVSDADTGETVTATLTLVNTSTGSLSANNGATYTAGTGVWTITDTVANVNLALANLVFTPTTDNEVDTTIDVVIDDGDEDASGPLTGTITLDVTPINDAPTATNLTTTSAYNEGDATVAITDIVVSDADAGETVTATLTLVNTSTGSLSANNGASYTAGTGVWTITDTVANVNLALANLVFTPNISNDVDTTINVVIDDGDEDNGGPLNGTITLDVTAVNSAPTISGTYTMTGTDEDTTSAAMQVSAILADVSITANDPDGDTLGMAVFAKTGLGSWQYSTDGVGGWTDFGAVNPNAAVLLSETTWVRYVPDGANGEIAGFVFRGWDQSTDFSSINGTPRFGDTVPGSGGTGAYSIGSATVSLPVSSINDQPRIVLSNATTAISDDVDTSSAIKVADIVITDDAMGTNILSLGGADAAMFEIVGGNALYLRAGSVLDSSANPSLDVTVLVDDTAVGGTPDDEAGLSIVVNHTNLPPTATHLNADETYTEDVPVNLKDIVVTDVDSTNVTVTLTLANPTAGSLNTGTSGTVTSTYTGGVWTASGAIADVNAILAGVVFTPAANFDGNFTIATSVDDGQAAPVNGIKVIAGIAVGDTPQAESIVTHASTQSSLISIDRNPDDGTEVTHFRISGITNGTLYLADGTTEIKNGDFVTVAQGMTGVRFSPTPSTMVNGSFIVESSEDGVTVALQSGSAISVVSVIPPTSPTESRTPTDSGATDTAEPEVAPEDPETAVEPEINPEEELPEAIIAPAKPGQAGKPILPVSGGTNAGSSFLIHSGQLFDDDLVTGADANQSDDRQADTTAARSERGIEDSGPGLADRIAKVYNRIAAKAYLNMLNTLDDVKEERDGDIALTQTVLGSAIVMSTSLSVGYVVWMIRGGMLLSSLLSSIPAWQILDPLPVLARKNNDDDDDDESLESILDRKPQGDAAKKKNTPSKSQVSRRRSYEK